MELVTKGAAQPGLHPVMLVPGNALKEWVNKADQHKGGGQLRVEPGALGNAARYNGRNGCREGQQEEKAGDVIAAFLRDLCCADEKVSAVSHGKTNREIGDG